MLDGTARPHLADRAAFTEAFRCFYEPLVRYAQRITGDAYSASDVIQDVFAKLWEDRERITVEVSLKALLYTMVRNRALNAIRRNKRIADVAVAEARDVREEGVGSDDRLGAEDLRRRLYLWIDALPPRRREAFTLSRYHGLSHHEIAGIMGLSERTVDTHILLALRTLRERLDRLHNEDPSTLDR